MTGTNADDVRSLTYLACRLRKETHGACEWDEAGTHAVIATLVGQSLPITVERVTRHAGDVTARTPKAITARPFIPGPPVAGQRFPVKAGEDCPKHVGEDRYGCRLCPVERYTHPEDPVTRDDVGAGLTLRAQIAQRREQMTTTEEQQ